MFFYSPHVKIYVKMKWGWGHNVKTQIHTLVLPCAVRAMHFAHIDAHLHTICVGRRWQKWGTHHWTSKLLVSRFSSSSSITDLSAHSRVFPQERDEAMLHEEDEEGGGGGGGKWQKIGDAELTVKHDRGTVVVLWKRLAHYSVRHRGSSLLSLPAPNFAANYERPHATPVRGDAKIFGSDGFAARTTLHRHIKLEYCKWGGVMRHKHQWSKTPVFPDCNVPHILCIHWLNSKYPKKMRYGMMQLQSSTDINVCKNPHYATQQPAIINLTIKLDKTTKKHNNAT